MGQDLVQSTSMALQHFTDNSSRHPAEMSEVYSAIGRKDGLFREWVPPLSATQTTGRNTVYSLGEYAVLPVIHLVATPFLIRHLGLDLYGIWMLINSIVGLAGAVDLGLGEATIRFVSLYRGRGDRSAIHRTVQTAFWASCPLAVCFGILVFSAAAPLIDHAFLIPIEYRTVALQSFQIGAALAVIRMVEAILIGTLRGYERYDVAAMTSVGIRATSLCSAVVMAMLGFGLPQMLLIIVALSALGLLAEGMIVGRLMQASPWVPFIDRTAFRKMFAFGGYAWVHGSAWLIFSQIDRVIIGAFLGTSALGIYSVCMQLAQPIHGAVGAGFATAFPAMSRRYESVNRSAMSLEVAHLIRLNLASAVLLAMPVIYFSGTILTLWMGQDFMLQADSVFRLLVAGSFIQATGVVPYFLLLGAGDAKFVSLTSFAGMAAMLLATLALLPVAGIYAPAVGRLLGACIAYGNYARLVKLVKEECPISCDANAGQEAQPCTR